MRQLIKQACDVGNSAVKSSPHINAPKPAPAGLFIGPDHAKNREMPNTNLQKD
jgi:hypothetical protein